MSPVFLLFENSKAIADFDTKAVSKIDQKWRILTRRRSVKSISWNDSPQGQPADPTPPQGSTGATSTGQTTIFSAGPARFPHIAMVGDLVRLNFESPAFELFFGGGSRGGGTSAKLTVS